MIHVDLVSAYEFNHLLRIMLGVCFKQEEINVVKFSLPWLP